MKTFLLLCLCLTIATARASDPKALEFQEAFAWGDRAAALITLVPNTEDYFFYHCLNYQLTGDRVAFEQTLNDWLASNQNRWNARMQEMRRRQHLLDFEHDPARVWKFLRDDLGLRFEHRALSEQRAERAPARLNPDDYALNVFLAEARRRSSGFLDALTPRGLDLALRENLSPEQRRALLGRLQRPDYSGLTDMILADLEFKDSRGFGQHNVHRLLTSAQLEELGRRRPVLLQEQAYVDERLARMPPPDTDLSNDHAAAVQHYAKLWRFVATLDAMHNSLKASVLYQLLDHQRQLGIYDETLFQAYLELPRQVPYLPREQMAALQRRQTHWVNFNYQPGREIELPPIRDEEPLVREFLVELLRGASRPDAYAKFFETQWLRSIFAESKILHGIGQPEDWAAYLAPAQYRALLDRIELNFALQNPSYLRPGDAVTLQVDVKRVDSLQVKIYELQTFNYYTTQRAPVDQAVDLDGMIATHERSLDTRAAPGRRVRHTLAFPEITERGVYVVELIGGGISSRALIHLGHLESITQPTAHGLAVMVINETGEHLRNAGLWIDGREFSANAQGLILLPYSENPGTRFAVLRSGAFSSPERIQHPGEDYTFSAGIHLDQQNLPRRGNAKLILRPDLRVNNLPVDPALLHEATVLLASTDAKGIRVEREYPAEFVRNAEWVRSFYVPDDLRKLEVTVQARLRRRTDGEEISLSDSYEIDVNIARRTDTLKQIFMTPSAAGWHLEVLGLNGEALDGVPLNVRLRHPGFNFDVHRMVATDERGRVDLGPLSELASIQVSGPDNLNLQRTLPTGAASLPERIHLTAGETLSIPYPFENTPGLTSVSLWKTERGKIIEDASARVISADGELRIEGLDEGEYTLTLHEAGIAIDLAVSAGETRHGTIFGARRRLQQTETRLPSLAALMRDNEQVRITLRHATPSTRVAVRAARYADNGNAFPYGLGFTAPTQRRVDPPPVQLVSGRNIGDEFRYVLERRFREIFAGSLLERPGLILNPWELRETSADREQLRANQAYRRGRAAMPEAAAAKAVMSARQRAEMRRPTAVSPPTDIGYDFLPQGADWRLNLKPDDDGIVSIPLTALAEHTALDIIVIDRFGTSRRMLPLPDRAFVPRDVRLQAGLDPERAFSRQKNVRALQPGEQVVFPDLATTRYQVISSLGQAFDLLRALGAPAELTRFGFLKNWPELTQAEKQTKYNEFACHELHLFVYERDRAFFDTVVHPFLANKKDKTFVDRWLLEELTAEDTRVDTLQQRNAMELALLARRGGAPEVIQAALREIWELTPPDPEAFARRIRTALQAADLDETISDARQTARAQAISDSLILGVISPMMLRGTSGRIAELGGDEGSLALDAPGSARAAAAAAIPRKTATETLMSLREEAEPFEDMEPSEVFAGEAVPPLYRALPKTKEWAEQNYYQIRVSADTPDRIGVNSFWRDAAAGIALSPHLLEAHTSLTEALVALAWSGVPFSAAAPEEIADGAALTIAVKSPALLVSEQILPAQASDDDRPLLISQQFFQPDDAFRFEGNERIEKFVTGEFIRRRVYGARITLTNPSASRRRLNLLAQIPRGAIPVRDGFTTDDIAVTLEAYTTRIIETFFYFPESGVFVQFPPHAAADEAIIGQADNTVFQVVDAPTEVDQTSWAWISQHAEPAAVLSFLRENNLRRLNLDEMAWRLRDRNFFTQAWEILAARMAPHDTTYAYALFHQDAERAEVFLSRSRIAAQVGPVLTSPLLTIDPVNRKIYEHLEYDPLVNPRVHPVGASRKILNTALDQQYRAFLFSSMYRARLDASARLALVYYLLLQDRISEARNQLAELKPRDLHEQLQADYLRAWLALRSLDLDRALALVTPHREHPVPRWRERFQALAGAIAEARGEITADTEDPTRQQVLDRAADQAPWVELALEGGGIRVSAHNLPRAILNLYPIDIELLFSRRPFLAAGGSDFGVVKPAFSRAIDLPAGGASALLELPADFRDRNMMVEIEGRGIRASLAWFANRLRIRIIQSFGQIEVRAEDSGEVLPQTYVKVYARGANGQVSFWKDGYTDLRGRFDYLSLNDREPEEAITLAILIMHPERGAVIRETTPPTR